MTDALPSARAVPPLPPPHGSAATYGDVRLFYGVVPPGSFAEHAHPEIEVAVPLGRASNLAIWQSSTGGSVSRWAGDGDVSILPPGQPHAGEWLVEADVLIFYLASRFLETAADSAGERFELVGTWANDDLIRQLALSLRREFRLGPPPSRLHVDSAATLLAVHLRRTYAVGAAVRDAPGGVVHPGLRRALEFVDANLAADLSLADIAAAAALSPYHFARLFKRATGETPLGHVARRRIERARELLRGGDHSVAEVAGRVGFADHSHFTRTFKRLTGVAPSTLLPRDRKAWP